MNLFLISQFGQLIHHQALIKRDNIANNKLVILYTSANLDVPRKIQKEADRLLFDETILYQLQLSPLNYHFDDITKMTEGFKNLLSGVDNLYMSSFEYHYSILHRLAVNRGIKTHLVEEGLATYKFVHTDHITRKPKLKRSVITATQQSGLFYNKFYPILKFIYTWTRDLINLPAQVFSTIVHCKNSEFISYKKLIKVLDERSAFLGVAKEFDSIHTAFPHLLNNCFNAQNKTELKTYDSEIFEYRDSKRLGNLSIKNKDILYLSQMYNIPSVHYASSVISIIEEYLQSTDDGRCFIKFHPRDKSDFISSIKSQVIEKKLVDRIEIIAQTDFPVESIIIKYKPKMILGISTTTLVYTNQISTDINCVSVTGKLLEHLGTHCPKKTRKTILEHTAMLNAFEHIEKV
ncbi:hypothetical protein BCT30_21545 [Enterovibrio norvegicus]|uniref:alpha-2,8-polysialyltransferase family protein n=1 Tax=Enterovibrio norvegicus TaxID=188144 RepID=UPI000C82C079|nr:alpha-2,8-polysialyltransferase family protein [Enterovibrio norvegicus]PMI35241.1 hypothetical protein BCU46_19070 [Enterovibrio norvegicus]PMN47119.1 hypothetical protein BCT30_21545 [Enterovibrio norvegicus]